MDKRRPSLFNTEDEDSGLISINLSEHEIITLITSLQYACKMYSLTEKIMREQGNAAEADMMKRSADIAMDMANKLIIDADPGYPERSTEFM